MAAPPYSSGAAAGIARAYVPAAANDVVACALGNDSPDTTPDSGGSPSSCGRGRLTLNLIA
jgi:hypothetical protein